MATTKRKEEVPLMASQRQAGERRRQAISLWVLAAAVMLAVPIAPGAPASVLAARVAVTPTGEVTPAVGPPRPESRPIRGLPGRATDSGSVNLEDLARDPGSRPREAGSRSIVAPRGAAPATLVPAGVLAPTSGNTLEATGAGPAVSGQGVALSPLPTSSFAAQEDTGWIPPDTQGAAGPNHLVVALNGAVTVLTRSGVVVAAASLDSFWRSAFPGVNTFDPKVLYDAAADRWILVSMADAETAGSALLVGTSTTGDPTGDWNLARVDADATDTAWADFPSVGLNSKWLVVSVNMFADAFERPQLYAFSKAVLYAGGATFRVWDSLSSTAGFALAPATVHDASATSIWLLTSLIGDFSGDGYLGLYTVTGAVGAEVLSPVDLVVAPGTPWAGWPGTANFAPQLGTTDRIDAGDDRIQKVEYRNGSLWAAQTVFLPADAPTRSAIQWWNIATDGTVIQRGRLDDATGTTFYAYPSIAANNSNDVLVGYSRFSGMQYPSANYAMRSAADPAGTLKSEVVLKAGEAPYTKAIAPDARIRWGDYSATMVDPVNDLDFWTIQEYAETPTTVSRWGTWWGQVTVPPPSNTAPTISDILDQSTPINTPEGPLAFTVGDAETDPGSLEVAASSSNPTLVPDANITFGGAGADRTVTITPATGQAGTATITVTVSDGSLTAQDTFVQAVVAPDTGVTASGVGVSYAMFYPYKDGYRDRVAIRGTPGEPLSVTVKIRNGAGKKVRSWSLASRTDSWSISWNGRTESGTRLPAGTYTITQTMRDALGHTLMSTASTRISDKRLYWSTATITKNGDQFSMYGDPGSGNVSRAKSAYARGVRLSSGTSWVAVGYSFTLRAAKLYDPLRFKVLGRSPNARTGEEGLWNSTYGPGNDVGSYDRKTIGPAYRWYTLKRASSTHRSGRSTYGLVYVEYAGGTQKFDVSKVRLVYRYAVLR